MIMKWDGGIITGLGDRDNNGTFPRGWNTVVSPNGIVYIKKECEGKTGGHDLSPSK